MFGRSVFVSLFAVLGGMALAGTMPRQGYVFVAAVMDRSLPAMHVNNLLSSKGIHPIFADGFHIGVEVPRKDGSKTVEILKTDALKHPYHYTGIEGYKGKLQMSSLAWKTLKFSLALDSALDSKPLKFDANLRGMVNEAKKRYDGFKNYKMANPYLSEVSYAPMSYMNAKGKWETGYYGTVKFRSRTSKASVDASIYSWDSGRKSSCTSAVSSTE